MKTVPIYSGLGFFVLGLLALFILAYFVVKFSRKLEHMRFLEKYIYLKGRIETEPVTKENFESIDAEFRDIICNAEDRKKVQWLWFDFIFRFDDVNKYKEKAK